MKKSGTGRVFLLCGMVCSGKSTYAKKLRAERGAAVLSIDDLTLSLFDEHLGDKFDEVFQRALDYLFRVAAEFAGVGGDVVLDFGAWTREGRRAARAFFAERGIETELHYLPIGDAEWRRRIAFRNREIREGRVQGCYFIDENMMELFAVQFEVPDDSEIDVIITSTS